MNVSNLKGLAKEIQRHRPDTLVPGAAVHSSRRQEFQAKISAAGKQLESRDPGSVKRDSTTKAKQQSDGRLNAKPGATLPVPQSVNGQRAAKCEIVRTQRHGSSLAAALQRKRHIRKLLPKRVREKMLRLTDQLGLTLADASFDASQQSVTLIIEQPGFSKTQFVIECEDTMWHVNIRSDDRRDTDSLQANRDALQERFNVLRLGSVFVDVTDRALSPVSVPGRPTLSPQPTVNSVGLPGTDTSRNPAQIPVSDTACKFSVK